MKLGRIIQRSLKRTLRGRRNTVTVTLHYDDAPAPSDVNDEDAYAEGTPGTATLKALVHFVTAAEVQAKGLLELKASDIIMDFDPSVSFDGMNSLRFTVDGGTYVQKTVGKETLDYFDLLVGGERMFRTVVASLVEG